MNTLTVTYGVFAHPKVTDLLRRLERAGQRRGYLIAHTITEPTRSALYRMSRKTWAQGGEHWAVRDALARKGYWLDKTEEKCEWWVRMERTLTLTMPDLSDDYEVMATIAPADPNNAHGSGAIINANPMFEGNLPEAPDGDLFLDRCDHCESGRRGRHKTVWLRSKRDGTADRLVGSSCLWEYAAIDIGLLSRLVEVKDMMNEGWGGGGPKDTPTMLLSDYAARVALWAQGGDRFASGLGRQLFEADAIHDNKLVIKGFNADWTPVCTVRGHVTDGVTQHLAKNPPQLDEPTQAIQTAFIEYVLSMEPSSTFARNVRNAAESGVITAKTAAYVGGSASRWVKDIRNPPTPEITADTPDMGHWETAGERWAGEQVLTCTGEKHFEGNYGPTTLLTFATPEGHVLKWFRSGDKRDITQDMTFTLTGAFVKKHGDYKGRTETQINRAKWVVEA